MLNDVTVTVAPSLTLTKIEMTTDTTMATFIEIEEPVDPGLMMLVMAPPVFALPVELEYSPATELGATLDTPFVIDVEDGTVPLVVLLDEGAAAIATACSLASGVHRAVEAPRPSVLKTKAPPACGSFNPFRVQAYRFSLCGFSGTRVAGLTW